MRPRIILLGLAGCLMLGMFAYATAGALLGQTHPAEAGVAGSLQAPPNAPSLASAGTTEMSAPELWMAYSRDAAGTDRRFRDRPLLVTGTVHSVERDFEGRLVARLDTGDAFETVNATMATRDDAALAGVNKGRPVSLLCVGRGVLMGAPLLGGCFVK